MINKVKRPSHILKEPLISGYKKKKTWAMIKSRPYRGFSNKYFNA